jgi:hypothetical protein
MRTPAEPVVMQLVNELDNKFARWDLWRTADKRWVVKVEQATQQETFDSEDMGEAMLNALQWRALPLAPRPQRRMTIEGFEVRKNGSYWALYYDGQFMGGGIKTKREAMKAADKWVERSNMSADEWDANYSWTETQTEGVDFRWAR